MLRWEIKKLIKNTWNLPILAGVIILWVIILYFAAQKGSDQLLMTSATFWHVLGSLAAGFMILFVNTRMFILDEEEKVKEVILTTRKGKARVLLLRMIATVIYITWTVALFLLVQIIVFLIFNRVETDLAITFITDCLESFLYVWIGSVLFSIFTACICTIFKSHMATVILCGILFGLTYLLRGSLLQHYSFEWFLEKGFFSYLIRAKDILLESQLIILTIWYGILIVSILMLTIKWQLRRHEI